MSPGDHEIARHRYTDKTFLNDLRAGSEQAFETLLDRHEAALYRFFYYSHKDRELAQDQCGETLEAFIRAIGHKQAGSINNVKCYLFGIARNVMRRHWRGKSLVRTDGVVIADMIDPGSSVIDELATQEEFRRAMDAIEQLSDPERQIILLRFVEMFKVEEIAGIMEMPVNTIKSHIHRGRKKLCSLLNHSPTNNSEF